MPSPADPSCFPVDLVAGMFPAAHISLTHELRQVAIATITSRGLLLGRDKQLGTGGAGEAAVAIVGTLTARRPAVRNRPAVRRHLSRQPWWCKRLVWMSTRCLGTVRRRNELRPHAAAVAAGKVGEHREA